MKKQILTFMALALFTFTGTAFAANSMPFSTASAGDIQMTPEIQVVQPDSATKKGDCTMTKKEKMKKGEMGKMHGMQDMKNMSKGQKQAMMSKMMMLRQHMMQMMENAKKANGNGTITQKQKDEMYAMMLQMMPKDKAQREKMVQMNARMVQMIKSGDMSKKNEMMAKMDPEMKAKMMKMMPKTPEEKAKMKETCTLMQQMMQRMQKEDMGSMGKNSAHQHN